MLALQEDEGKFQLLSYQTYEYGNFSSIEISHH